MSIRTKCFTVCFTLKNVPVMERPYKCIDKYILPMDEPPRVSTVTYTKNANLNVKQTVKQIERIDITI